MGLKQRLLQGQTTLSAGSFPGDTPINDPQSGFVQENSPTNTYDDEIMGQPNNGSVLINTLSNTSLDNTQPLFDTATSPPSTTTDYPPLVSGEFGSAPSQYSSPYNSTNTYLDNVPIQDPNSPQLPTLEQTGLDNTNTNSEPTSVTPNSISYPNNYPELVSGEFGGAPSPYGPQYNVENTYLNSIDDINNTPQVTSLFFTGLDNTNANAEPTTVVPNNILYPNNYPVLTSGEFNGAPSQYVSIYNTDNTYLNSISDINNTPQVDTLGQTGLDNTNANADSTTIIPDNISYPNNYPQLVSGEFNGAPSQYVSLYNSNDTYLNQITLPEFGGIQSSSLLDSGLSIDTSNAVETTFIVPLPDTITTYPSDNVTSIIGGAPQPFNQLWGQSKFYYDYMKENFEAH